MAEHRARHHASQTNAIPASDLLARLDQRPDGVRASRRPHTATGSTLATPAVSMGSLPSFTLPTIGIPGLPSMPAMTPARSRRMVITAVLAGALGVAATGSTATGSTAGGSTAVTPQSSDVQLATQPAAAAAAAAFVLPGSSKGDIEPSAITGADLAAGALPWAVPAPVPALDPATPVPDTAAPAPATQEATNRAATNRAATNRAAADRAAADRAAADKEAADEAAKKLADEAAKTAAAAGASPAAADGRGSSVGVKALTFAKAALGKPYRYGASGPNAFDCSGLVMSAFRKAGVRLPRTSAAQSKVGTAVGRDQLQPGDLLFFYTPVSHVGIYLGDGKMVHASTSGQPVKISRIGGRPVHNARRI